MTSAIAPLLQDPVNIPGWASLGVGGSIAIVIFYFWRHDNAERDKREVAKAELDAAKAETGRQNGRQREDRLLEVVSRNAVVGEKLSNSVDGLKAWLENGYSRPVKRTKTRRRRRV